MGWPFSNAPAPSFDSGWASPGAGGAGAFAVVPNSAAGAAWLMGAHFDNTGVAQQTVSLRDGNGVAIITDLAVPGKTVIPIEWPFLPVIGPLQWECSVLSGVNGKVWGYQ